MATSCKDLELPNSRIRYQIESGLNLPLHIAYILWWKSFKLKYKNMAILLVSKS